MHEVELKLQVPTHKRTIVKNAIQKLSPDAISLHAQYFDTPDFAFSKHYAALRLRKENQNWVQTLKAGNNTLSRYENEIDRGISEHAPKIALDLYKNDKKAQKLLSNIFSKDNKNKLLEIKFETIVERKFQILNHENTQVEVCLDIGSVGNEQYKKQEIYELEFELKHGNVQDLIELVQSWVKKYHIWLDVRSKAERGHLIARQLDASIAETFKIVSLDKKLSCHQASQHIVSHYIQQLLPNIAVIADQVAESKHFTTTQLCIENICHSLDLLSAYIPKSILDQSNILKDLNQMLLDFNHLYTLQHQTYTSTENYDFKNISRVLEKYKLDFSKAVTSPQFTLLILELLKFSLPTDEKKKDETPRFEKLLTEQYTQIKQQLCEKLETPLDPSLFGLISQFQYYLNHSHKYLLAQQMDKSYFSEVYDLYKNHLLSKDIVLRNIKAIKTEQFFLFGWISAREDKIFKRYSKLMSKLKIK